MSSWALGDNNIGQREGKEDERGAKSQKPKKLQNNARILKEEDRCVQSQFFSYHVSQVGAKVQT